MVICSKILFSHTKNKLKPIISQKVNFLILDFFLLLILIPKYGS
jgi:hypothetical protein